VPEVRLLGDGDEISKVAKFHFEGFRAREARSLRILAKG